MTLRRPIIQVEGPSGRDLVPLWGPALTSVHITDARGYESDQLVLTFADAPPSWSAPPRGTHYKVYLGWEGETPQLYGVYTSQRNRYRGSPDEGCGFEVVCRAADMVDKLKTAGTGHYDGKTVGEIVGDIAREMGVEAAVAADIADRIVPYRLRWYQGAGDFLTRLGDDIGAVIKPQAGKLVALKRGSGQSAGGKDLPAITFTYDPLYEFEADVEPRGQYAKVRGGWIDPKTGSRKTKVTEGSGAGTAELVHPFASEDDLDTALAAAKDQQEQQAETATFSGPGDARAIAEAPVKATGFGADIDGKDWIAETVDMDIVPDGGWTMTVQCTVKGQGGGSGSKKSDVIDDPESEW
ncbi:putative phage late control D protein [uncultured Pleomorphomonas sp.]|uniref:Putative phage late control D protein n=1 Tax=uncultured Pleomorphomonas sp. TaxID=442121 RepID=A0A212LD93_9HYPH|nr:hypothetical protein [uncultured Pleomorphomonas sp.]SCM75457.1 putative phage late control D protein [uncultured Pleomorphomonas sp.]